MKKILVYGFYYKGNIGDDLFIASYRHLFPDFELTFTDNISIKQLQKADAVFFGGGSFLLEHPNFTEETLQILKSKKIFYIGVGVEAIIHPMHLELMSYALLLAIRSPEQAERLKKINSNVLVIPDLVYALQDKVMISSKIDRSVLVIPNITVVPQRVEPHWKHTAWAYFKSEFTQFLDWLVDNDYQPKLFSMCHSIEEDDGWVSGELIGHMEKRNRDLFLHDCPSNIQELTRLFSQYEIIITQRFHGIVLSEMTRTPYIAIHHHDKLKLSQPGEGRFISYYNSSKHTFIEAFNQARMINYANIMPIESNIFKALVEQITSLL